MFRLRYVALILILAFCVAAVPARAQTVVQEYVVPAGSHPHDVAPAADGGVWLTAQGVFRSVWPTLDCIARVRQNTGS